MPRVPRVRFAPSPTGLMHLGNVRTALMNYLFARQKNGIYVLRIEDTDQQRTIHRGVERILEYLDWLDIRFSEGPFFQSQRSGLYQQYLEKLKERSLVYRCFCTPEELEKRRERQIACKMPPRYDRLCLGLSAEEIDQKITDLVPFTWRVQLDHALTVTIEDMAHGKVAFELKNFSDFPVTRSDGTFTFLFANFVDDVAMEITHVIRGEDHLTNTACQAFLYTVLGYQQPVFWHLTILCNAQGAKLSKRDFGFSLGDLQEAGFLPEAIVNYLAISGCGSFEAEIMSLEELINQFDFTKIHSSDRARYDLDRLRWINHKWIQRISSQDLTQRVIPFLQKAYPGVSIGEQLGVLIDLFKSECTTLADSVSVLGFVFAKPVVLRETIESTVPSEYVAPLVELVKKWLADAIFAQSTCVEVMKRQASAAQIPLKYMFSFVRLALTGKPNGPGIAELMQVLSVTEVEQRLEQACLEAFQGS